MVKNKNSVFRISVGILSIVMVAGFAYNYYGDSLFEKRRFSKRTEQSHGVTFYDRLRTNSDNYLVLNLAGDGPQTCTVLDYEGRVIHKFPSGACKFSESGDFYLFSDFASKFGSDGRIKWKTKKYKQHHSLDFYGDDNEIFFVGRAKDPLKTSTDVVVGLSPEGKEIFYWRADKHLDEISKAIGRPARFEPPDGALPIQHTHINSVQVIPPNEMAKKIPAFKPGNIFVNCFMHAVLFIIDRETHKIVWSYVIDKRRHHGAHAVRVLPNGHIFMFLNKRRARDVFGRQYSSVAELDPITNSIIWEYIADPPTDLFSSKWGSATQVGEDQFLVVSSERGFAAQLDRRGRILWEWYSVSEVNHQHQRYELVPVFEILPVKKKIVDDQIKKWKEFGNPMGDDFDH